MNLINICEHPFDTHSLLAQMLTHWDDKPNTTIMVLTGPKDSDSLINRVRVKLSGIRRQLNNEGERFKLFSIHTLKVPEEFFAPDVKYEVVMIRQVKTLRHCFAELDEFELE